MLTKGRAGFDGKGPGPLCKQSRSGQPAGCPKPSLRKGNPPQRGLAAGAQTALPFDVNGADVLVLDDVLYTGRTIRAVLNELFDYGRPASVRLAVLVDRGGRGWQRARSP